MEILRFLKLLSDDSGDAYVPIKMIPTMRIAANGVRIFSGIRFPAAVNVCFHAHNSGLWLNRCVRDSYFHTTRTGTYRNMSQMLIARYKRNGISHLSRCRTNPQIHHLQLANFRGSKRTPWATTKLLHDQKVCICTNSEQWILLRTRLHHEFFQHRPSQLLKTSWSTLDRIAVLQHLALRRYRSCIRVLCQKGKSAPTHDVRYLRF